MSYTSNLYTVTYQVFLNKARKNGGSYWILALMSWMFLKEFDFSVICLNTSQIKTLPSRLESEKSSTFLLEFCGGKRAHCPNIKCYASKNPTSTLARHGDTTQMLKFLFWRKNAWIF